MTPPCPPSPARPRRAVIRALLAAALSAQGDAAARQALDRLAPDGPHGAVLAERLRFGPPETWMGWRPGCGAVAVKLWPCGPRLRPLPRVDHPGVVPLLDQGMDWRLFAWVEGVTLARALRQGSPCPQWGEAIAAAVAALHAAGIAHGDLTPANVVIGADGLPVLIDWGEEVAGTPDWRPCQGHDDFERDRHALDLICARLAGNTPAAAHPRPPGRE